jgi:acyl CoA:acetate/3-ketoacid CoA transferase beta subunit
MAGAGVGGGAASSAASSMISGLVNVGTGAATGAVNILSSLLVGTATRNGTAGAYGTPLTPDANGQKPYAGPSVVNNWNGGVHTSNNEEFYRIQQRRELQNAAPMLPNR